MMKRKVLLQNQVADEQKEVFLKSLRVNVAEECCLGDASRECCA